MQNETLQSDTRLFFVVDGADINESLHETFAEAFRCYNAINSREGDTQPRIRVCYVQYAYRDETGEWNYDDYEDTFETIQTIM